MSQSEILSLSQFSPTCSVTCLLVLSCMFTQQKHQLHSTPSTCSLAHQYFPRLSHIFTRPSFGLPLRDLNATQVLAVAGAPNLLPFPSNPRDTHRYLTVWQCDSLPITLCCSATLRLNDEFIFSAFRCYRGNCTQLGHSMGNPLMFFPV